MAEPYEQGEDSAFSVKDERGGRFGVIYKDHVDTDAFRSLTCADRCVYYALLLFVGHHSGKAWPKVSTLMQLTAFSESTVYRGLRVLKQKGFIDIGKKEFTRARRVNLYTLLSPDDQA